MSQTFVIRCLVALLFAGVCLAAPENYAQQQFTGQQGGVGGNDARNNVSPPLYSYSYEATDSASGNAFSHGEQRDGENTEGVYRVLLPDGRTQVVRYTVAGPSGYQSEVTYE